MGVSGESRRCLLTRLSALSPREALKSTTRTRESSCSRYGPNALTNINSTSAPRPTNPLQSSTQTLSEPPPDKEAMYKRMTDGLKVGFPSFKFSRVCLRALSQLLPKPPCLHNNSVVIG